MKFTSFIFSLILPVFIYAAPIVTSVTPSHGPASGGTVVQISGSGFTYTNAVHFGTVEATSFSVLSDFFITATAPATFAPGTIDVTVTSISGTSPVSDADRYTYIEGDWYAYTSLLNTTYLAINLTTNTPGTSFALPNDSEGSAITPNGQIATISDIGNTLIIDQLATQQPLLPLVNPNASVAIAVAISPDGKTAYLATEAPTGVQSFDIASETFGTVISLPSPVDDIAITPDGTRLYALTAGGVYPIDLSLGMVGVPISLPSGFQIRITPDGTKAFLTSFSGNASYIDLITNTGFNTISLGSSSSHLAISPDGKTVYFLLGSGNLVPVDTATLAVGATIVLPNFGSSIAITPDSKTAYIVTNPSDITPVDLTTFAFGDPIPLDDIPTFIVISPDQAPIASFKVALGLPGLPTAFDASASISPVGSIVDYAWNFGDGHTLNTASPTVSHTYALSGTYTVTLTVTNSGGTSTVQTYTGQTVSNNGGPSARAVQDIHILPLLPPANVRGFQTENKFLMQNDIVNVVVWTAPSGSAPAATYNVYSDAGLTNLLAIIPANGELKFVQHNAHERPYTYYLISVDAQGNLSAIVSVLVKPESKE